MNRAAVITAIILTPILWASAWAEVTVTSPNGRISAVVEVVGGKLCYTAYKDGKPAYDRSSLGSPSA